MKIIQIHISFEDTDKELNMNVILMYYYFKKIDNLYIGWYIQTYRSSTRLSFINLQLNSQRKTAKMAETRCTW